MIGKSGRTLRRDSRRLRSAASVVGRGGRWEPGRAPGRRREGIGGGNRGRGNGRQVQRPSRTCRRRCNSLDLFLRAVGSGIYRLVYLVFGHGASNYHVTVTVAVYSAPLLLSFLFPW